MISRGKRGHVAAEEVDGQRHAEADVEEPHRREGAADPQIAVDLEQGDHRDEVRHDEQADDDDEHRVAAGELHEREGVGGEGGDEDRDEGRRQRDGQAVEEGIAESGVHPRVVVIPQGEAAPVGGVERRPPTAGVRVALAPERGDERAQRWDDPQEADHDHDQLDRPVSGLLLDGAGPAGEPGDSRFGGGWSARLDRAGHRFASWSRNWRTWKIMTGMIAIMSMTTMAAA